jgi:hypothetical protein
MAFGVFRETPGLVRRDKDGMGQENLCGRAGAAGLPGGSAAAGGAERRLGVRRESRWGVVFFEARDPLCSSSPQRTAKGGLTM